MQGLQERQIEADISRLETGIRQLKIQYDMFLNGALPREPVEARQNLETLIRRYANAPIRKYQHRFHFNALVARFNCLSELWGKHVRQLEEGERPNPAVADRAAGSGPRVLATHSLAGTLEDEDRLRRLHSSFLEARRKAGQGNGQVPYESFARKVLMQAHQMRKEAGCSKVEVRLVMDDDTVLLKARPGR